MDARWVTRLPVGRWRDRRSGSGGIDSYADAQSEALLRAHQERFYRHPTSRTTIVDGISTAGFLLCALALAIWAPAGRSLSVVNLLVVAVLLIAALRVKFPVVAATTWPAQLAFVPMLFLLPLRDVPLIETAVMQIEFFPRLVRAHTTPTQTATRIVANLADNWFTLGPVAVLLLFSDQHFAWAHWPVYLLAFAAQITLDLTSGLLRTAFAEGLVVRAQINIVWLYLIDAGLSCLGLQSAAVGVRRPGLVLLELPLIGLLGMFARERRQRMEGTLALSSAYRATALLLGDVIEDDDEYTGLHSQAVVELSLAVADRMGLGINARQRVEFGALLHDVGKIREPKDILHKPGPLNEEEKAEMRLHTIYGDEMLKQLGGTLAGIGQVVRGTHEHWDGSGYPDGLSGEAIPIESRIVAACDAYNAMTTDRPYRAQMPAAAAAAELRRCGGTQFDPVVVAALLEEIAAGE